MLDLLSVLVGLGVAAFSVVLTNHLQFRSETTQKKNDTVRLYLAKSLQFADMLYAYAQHSQRHHPDDITWMDRALDGWKREMAKLYEECRSHTLRGSARAIYVTDSALLQELKSFDEEFALLYSLYQQVLSHGEYALLPEGNHEMPGVGYERALMLQTAKRISDLMEERDWPTQARRLVDRLTHWRRKAP